MRRGSKAFVAFALFATSIGVAARNASGVADAPGCVQLSVPNIHGNEPDGETFGFQISPDGRYVLFASSAIDLGVVDLNGQERDVFVRDMQTGAIEIITKTTAGAQLDRGGNPIAISPNGQFVLFTSQGAFNGTDNGFALYLRDRQQGTTTLVVGHYTGYFITYGTFGDLSDDGRFVVFVTAESLVPQDTNGLPDVYRLDRALGQTVLVSVADDETPLPLGAIDATMSANGDRVAFYSESMHWTGIRDIAAGTTRQLLEPYVRITADGNTLVGIFGSEIRTIDANTLALISSYDAAISANASPILDMSANGRYLMMVYGRRLYQFDRILQRAWDVPSTYDVAGYVTNDGMVSGSSMNRRAYLWRGPIISVDNAVRTYVEAGTTKDVLVSGRNIFPGASFSFGEGTTTTVIDHPWGNAVNLRVSVDGFALDGPRDLIATAPISGCQTTTSQLFEVMPRSGPPPTTSTTTTTAPGTPTTTTTTTTTSTTTTRRGQIVPQVFDMSPAVLRPGEPQHFIVLGNNFSTGARIEIEGVTVTDTDYINNRRLEATVVVDPAARGERTVRVVNPDGEYGDSPHSIVIRGTDGEFHAQTPYRTYDSRIAGAPVVGERITPIGGLPSSGVRAVVANLTVTNPTADSYLTLYRPGTARPTTSSINFRAGETKANLVTFEVNDLSELAVFNAYGSADVVFDVVGYYTEASATSGSAFVGTDPYRRFDSRVDRSVPLGPGESISMRMLNNGEPAAAVLLNVTAANPNSTSYLTVWPSGSARPGTSNVNFDAGQTVPNAVLVPVGANGEVSFYNYDGHVDIVVDVLGWYDNGAQAIANGRFISQSPQRVIDTRLGIGAPLAPLGPQGTVSLDASRSDISPTATALIMNVTVDQPTTGGYVTVWPGASAMPGTSNLNFGPAVTTANLIVVRIGTDRRVNFFNAYGSTHVIADVVGYFE